MKFNLREACHLIELRTVPQGHIDYRRIAQQMFKEINKIHPNLSKVMKFVDLKEYDLERFESEKRTEEKRKRAHAPGTVAVTQAFSPAGYAQPGLAGVYPG